MPVEPPAGDAGVEDGGPACAWRNFAEGLAGGAVGIVRFDPRTADVAWAASGATLYRSTDDGHSWVRWAELPQPMVDLTFAPDDAARMLVATRRGVLESLDGGRSWRELAFDGLSVESLLVHPADGRRVIAAVDGAGLFRSVDGGSTWRAAEAGTTRRAVTALVGPASASERVYASADVLNSEGGPAGVVELLSSDDGGASWTVLRRGDGRNRGAAVCPSNGDVISANIGERFLFSTDGGRSFEEHAAPVENVDVLAFGTSGCDGLYLIAWGSGLWRSSDQGRSWTGPLSSGILERLTLVGLRDLDVDPDDPERLLVGSSGAGFASDTGGNRWVPIEGLGRLTIRDIATAGQRIWLSTWGSGLWTRDGRDALWSRVPVSSLPADYVYSALPRDDAGTLAGASQRIYRESSDGMYQRATRANAIDFAVTEDGVSVLAATQNRGVLASTNGGVTWAPDNDGLEAWPTALGELIDTRSVTYVREEPGRALVGTLGNGLWARATPSSRWERVDFFDSADTVGCLLDADIGTFACVEGRGVVRSRDGGRTWRFVNEGLRSLETGGLVAWPEAGRVFAAIAGGAAEWNEGLSRWERVGEACVPGDVVSGAAVFADAARATLIVASPIDGPWAIDL